MAEKKMVLDDADRLMSLEEVGERLGTGYDTAARLVKAGLLPALSFKRVRRVPKSVFGEFVRKCLDKDLYQLLEEAENA